MKRHGENYDSKMIGVPSLCQKLLSLYPLQENREDDEYADDGHLEHRCHIGDGGQPCGMYRILCVAFELSSPKIKLRSEKKKKITFWTNEMKITHQKVYISTCTKFFGIKLKIELKSRGKETETIIHDPFSGHEKRYVWTQKKTTCDTYFTVVLYFWAIVWLISRKSFSKAI